MNFTNALGNIGLMYQGANAQELSDIQLKKLKQDQADNAAVNSALGKFDPGMLAGMFSTGGAGNDIVGTQPMPPGPPQGAPPQGMPAFSGAPGPGGPMSGPPPNMPAFSGAPGPGGPMSGPPPQGMPAFSGAPGPGGPMSGPPPNMPAFSGAPGPGGPMSGPPPQGMPAFSGPPPNMPAFSGAPGPGGPMSGPGGPQGAPPQGPPQGGPNPQAAALARDPFVQQAMSITQSLPPAQRGLFYKNFYMPMLQQRAEAQQSAKQFEEQRADRADARGDRRDATVLAHADRLEAIKERYDAAKLASEDRRASAADRADAREDALALRREMAEQNMGIKKGNLQARRDTLDMQRAEAQQSATQFEEQRADRADARGDRRDATVLAHADRLEAIKERYDAAKLASEDRRASAADRADAREDALALRREMAEQNMGIKKGNLQARRDTLDMQRAEAQQSATQFEEHMEIKKGNLQARRDTLDMQRGKLQEAAAKGDAAAKARLSELDDVQRQLDELMGLEGGQGNLKLGVTGAAGAAERIVAPVLSFVNSLTGKPPPDTSAAEIKSRVKAVVPQITKILSGSKSSNGGAWTQARVEEALGALSLGTTSAVAQADAAALKKDLEAHRGTAAVGQRPAAGKVLNFDAQGNLVQ